MASTVWPIKDLDAAMPILPTLTATIARGAVRARDRQIE
jgi:hypothetical protein